MHNNTKTTTFSVKKAHTYKTTRKQQTLQRNHTYTTTLKQQHLL